MCILQSDVYVIIIDIYYNNNYYLQMIKYRYIYLSKVFSKAGHHWKRYPPSGDGTSTPLLVAIYRDRTNPIINKTGTNIVINWYLSGELPFFGPMKVNIELQNRMVYRIAMAVSRTRISPNFLNSWISVARRGSVARNVVMAELIMDTPMYASPAITVRLRLLIFVSWTTKEKQLCQSKNFKLYLLYNT